MTSRDKTVYNALPKLPGYNFPELNEPATHGKRNLLTVDKDGLRTVKDPSSGADDRSRRVEGCGIPVRVILQRFANWKTLDDKVLRFFGYYMEDVVDSMIETSRVRKVKINFFLADGTISITETPTAVNSGLQKGTIVSRCKEDGIDVFTLVVGNTFTCRSLTYEIVDCDAATREFYEVMDMPQPEPMNYPIDEFEASSQKPSRGIDEDHMAMRRTVELQAAKAAGTHPSLLSAEERVKARNFFEHDMEVLRFYAVWDRRQFRILYYIADGGISIMFDNAENDGRDNNPIFAKKKRVPRNSSDMLLSSETLNRNQGPPVEYVTEADFRTGETTELYCRPFFIYDCDPYTRNYMSQRGIDMTPVPKPVTEQDLITVARNRPRPKKEVKPLTKTIGASRMTFEDAVDEKDTLKFTRFAQDVFRFGAVLKKPTESDEGRKFLVSYYLADDTMTVYEILVNNSGHRSGIIFARRRVPEISDPRQLKVGDTVKLEGVEYLLTDTDSRTQKYMASGMPDMDETHFQTQELISKIQQKILQNYSRTTDAFRQYASSPTQGLNREDIIFMYTQNGMRITEEQLENVMKKVDTDHDGWVSLADFTENFLSQQFMSDFKPKNEANAMTTTVKGGPIQSTQAIQSKEEAARKADEAFKNFLTITEARRTLLSRAFKGTAAETYDGNIGMQDFTECVRKRLNLSMTDDELESLLYKFYYSAGVTNWRARRLPLNAITALLKL
ncbi:rib72 protein-like protein [Angomonas deanei]|uniref:DUF1126 PH-like domain/EF-hand domain pair, putative n=1 Tax=Angomonas deanei TaxID=59799 RepID=A0A7G2C220_9TRYP|nr:rib72 protein-like protein [Angomonas deanei]CAD2213261.1 DUF1126 PH-like domain/EF-hand domain pair, putative [Angomonas deanei]|eukprot:EPY39580.1 rib72 protein-like protein [Angomonas deanei]